DRFTISAMVRCGVLLSRCSTLRMPRSSRSSLNDKPADISLISYPENETKLHSYRRNRAPFSAIDEYYCITCLKSSVKHRRVFGFRGVTVRRRIADRGTASSDGRHRL